MAPTISCEDERYGKENIMKFIDVRGHGTVKEREVSVSP